MTETYPITTPNADPTPTDGFTNVGLEETKARLNNVWLNFAEVKNVPELISLFDRTTDVEGLQPEQVLAEHDYPTRSKIENLDMGEWSQNLDPRFVKDGFIYLFRGDNPNQGAKGFYSRAYGYGKKTTEQLANELNGPEEVGYALYRDDRYLSHPQSHATTIASELAYMQSAKGGSSFISTTTNLEAARAGTGNQPTDEQKQATEIYILKVPVESVINSNTGNHFGLEEDEYLVPDYILPSEVIGRFNRDDIDGINAYMTAQLGAK